MKPAETKLETMLPSVVLPEGYCGKILLVSIAVKKERVVVLRSGDHWHREILRNTEAEIRALGLSGARVDELGGAHLRFEADGSIFIWGSSEQFGTCDYEYVAALLRLVWPGRKVASSFGEMP
ncbi:MAG: hypothetical protein ACYC5X_04050 [Syntrophales bacterium]